MRHSRLKERHKVTYRLRSPTRPTTINWRHSLDTNDAHSRNLGSGRSGSQGPVCGKELSVWFVI